MNRFKITTAKEKILRLREKYSKNANQEEAKSSSESLISMKSERSADQEKAFQQHTTILEKPVLPNSDDRISTGRMKEDLFEGGTVKEEILKADLELYVNITPESKFDVAEQSFEKPLSSGSLVLSDLSNQFEHIRFISSSNEDLSVVESENTQTKSRSTDSIPSVTIPERNKNSSNEEIGFLKVRENFKTFNTTERNSSLQSLSKSGSNESTKISSIKELINSESGTGNISHDTSFLGSARDSNINFKYDEKLDSTGSPPQNSEIGELSSNISSTSILKKKSSANVVVSKVREISTDSDADSGNSKIYKSNSNHIKHKGENERRDVSLDDTSLNKTSPKALNLQSATGIHTKHNDYVNQSTNTDPVKVIILKNRSKYHQHKHVAYANRPIGKMEKYKHTKLSKKQDFSVKQTTKRPFIKPCNLINQDESGNIESKGAIHQESQSLKHNLTDDFYNYPISVDTSVTNCDEVITLLLRNQIQLTRHLIKSHQRMYLQLYQAAQLLNVNHSARR